MQDQQEDMLLIATVQKQTPQHWPLGTVERSFELPLQACPDLLRPVVRWEGFQLKIHRLGRCDHLRLSVQMEDIGNVAGRAVAVLIDTPAASGRRKRGTPGDAAVGQRQRAAPAEWLRRPGDAACAGVTPPASSSCLEGSEGMVDPPFQVGRQEPWRGVAEQQGGRQIEGELAVEAGDHLLAGERITTEGEEIAVP